MVQFFYIFPLRSLPASPSGIQRRRCGNAFFKGLQRITLAASGVNAAQKLRYFKSSLTEICAEHDLSLLERNIQTQSSSGFELM